MNYLYGELNTEKIISEYTGLSTKTATVNVDPKRHTISVDVLGGVGSGSDASAIKYTELQELSPMQMQRARMNIDAQEKLPDIVEANSYLKVNVDSRGLVTGGKTKLSYDDLEDLPYLRLDSAQPQEVRSNLTLKYNALSGSDVDLLTVEGNVAIHGHLTQRGNHYIVDAEQIRSTNNLITLRDKNPLPISGIDDYSGLIVNKYDGVNDMFLVFGRDGFARVGKKESPVILAAREDNPIDKMFMRYDDEAHILKSDYIYESDINTTDYKISDITGERQLTTKEYVDMHVNKSGLYRVVADQEAFEEEKIGAEMGLRIFVKSEATV